MTLGLSSLLGARTTTTLAPLSPLPPLHHPPRYSGVQDRGDSWEHSGSEGWKGHYKDKGKDAALSALTLLAFLFFLHILQSCLQDMTNANQPAMMMMTTQAAAPARGPARADPATLVAVPMTTGKSERSRRSVVRVDEMDAVTGPGNTAEEVTEGQLSLETLPEDDVPIGQGVDGVCQGCREDDLDGEEADVEREDVLGLGKLASGLLAGVAGGPDRMRDAVEGIVDVLHSIDRSLDRKSADKSRPGRRREKRSTSPEEQARHLHRVAEQRRKADDQDAVAETWEPLTERNVRPVQKYSGSGPDLPGWEMVSVRAPGPPAAPGTPTLISPDGQVMVQVPVQVNDKSKVRRKTVASTVQPLVVSDRPGVLVPLNVPPRITTSFQHPPPDTYSTYDDEDDEEDLVVDKEGAGDSDLNVKNKQEEYELEDVEPMATAAPPTTAPTAEEAAAGPVLVMRPVAPVPVPRPVLTFVPLAGHLGGHLGGQLASSIGSVAWRALGLVARPFLRLLQPGSGAGDGAGVGTLCCDVVVCEARRLGSRAGSLGQRLASTVSNVVSWACGADSDTLDHGRDEGAGQSLDQGEARDQQGCRRQIQQCEQRAGRRTAVTTIAALLEAYLGGGG